jgi:hypothetical protein
MRFWYRENAVYNFKMMYTRRQHGRSGPKKRKFIEETEAV